VNTGRCTGGGGGCEEKGGGEGWAKNVGACLDSPEKSAGVAWVYSTENSAGVVVGLIF
jgi:hypothetical protein